MRREPAVLWLFAAAVGVTVVVARRRGPRGALARQVVAWLPALPLLLPFPGWLGAGFPQVYGPVALVVIGSFQVAMLLPERKVIRGKRGWPAGETALWLLAVLAAPVALAVLTGMHFAAWRYPGLGSPDESLLFLAAKRINEGAALYRDLEYPTGPGLAYLLAVLFRIAGPSLQTGKWLLGTWAVLGVWATYLLGRKVAPAPLAFLAAVACIPLPLPAGLTLAMLAVACVFREGWRREISWGVAGLLTGLAVACDPLMGALAAYALVVMAGVRRVGLVQRRVGGRGVDLGIGWRTIARYLGAMVVGTLPGALLVRVSGAWGWMVRDIAAHPWGALDPGMLLTIPVLPLVPAGGGWPAVLEASGRLGSIAAMLLGLAAGGVLLVRLLLRQWTERDFLAVTLVFMAGALTMRPFGVGYLAPVYLLAAFVAGWGVGLLARPFTGGARPRHLLGASCGLGALVLAAWPVAARVSSGEGGAFSRPGPAIMAPIALGSRSGNVRAPRREAEALHDLALAIQRLTPSGGGLVIVPGSPGICLLANRPSATRLAAVRLTDLEGARLQEILAPLRQGKAAALVLDAEMDRAGRERAQAVWALAAKMQAAGQYGRYRLWLVRAGPGNTRGPA